MPGALPENFRWVAHHAKKNGPNIMRAALQSYGVQEIPGKEHSQDILNMARFLGGVIEDFYTADEIPWCGLAVSYWIKKAHFEPPKNYSQVRARDFAEWGNPAKKPSFGDVLVFWRGARAGRDGHVGLYVMEDADTFVVYGGNQGDRVCFARLAKSRLIAARRCPWRISQPRGVRPFEAGANGLLPRGTFLSEDEV